MTKRINDVLSAMERVRDHPSIIYTSVSQMLRVYPEFIFTESMRGRRDIYHDLEKKVTPQGSKNSLNYQWAHLIPEINKELLHLLKVCNTMKKLLCVLKAARNKKFILSVLEHIFEVRLSTGGGTSPGVKRIIMIYEREGGIQRKKRKTGDLEDFSVDFEENEYPDPVENIVVIPAQAPSSPIKKHKILDTPCDSLSLEVPSDTDLIALKVKSLNSPEETASFLIDDDRKELMRWLDEQEPTSAGTLVDNLNLGYEEGDFLSEFENFDFSTLDC